MALKNAARLNQCLTSQLNHSQLSETVHEVLLEMPISNAQVQKPYSRSACRDTIGFLLHGQVHVIY